MRLEELAQAYAAGQLDEAELARYQEEALRVMSMEDNGPRSSVGDLAVNASLATDPADLPSSGVDAAETLEIGRVIGPPERSMRLMHDLSGKGRLWLARVVSPPSDYSTTADEFRAIKIFLPAGHDSGALENGRDERASRADLIGLRAYLAKVRSRVELAVRLEHPVIVRAHGWRQGVDGWPFIEMDYVDPRQGRTLAQWLDQEGQQGLPWEVIAKWLRPVASALDYARRMHRVACQHLDIDTVFITDQGAVKLLGFGLATEIREPRSVLFSTSGAGRETASEGGE